METTPTAPATFRELALRIVNQIYLDIHVNVAGLVFFTVLAYGVLHPEDEANCQMIANLAATYLFAASKTR